jgi:PAS domain S-box-containing protein
MTITKESRFRAICCFSLIFLSVFISPGFAIELSNEEKEYLQTKDAIVFVSQTRYPPFEFTDANQQHEGMMLDVVRWMAVEMGFKPVFMDMAFQEAQAAVLSGKADILTSLFYSDKRKEKFEFTETLFDVPASIFIKAERTDIKDLKDLNGKTIAIQRGDYAKDFLESQKIRFDTLDTENFAEATDMVIAGKADAVIGDEQIVLYHIFSNRLTAYTKKVGVPLYIGKNCMASKKNNTILVGILNKGIREARKSGVLDKISTKWLGIQFGLQQSFLDRNFLPLSAAAGGLLLLLLGVWVWNVRLRTLVRKKTADILRREEALRESETRYRLLAENATDVIWTVGMDLRLTYISPSVTRLLGFTVEEAMKRTMQEAYTPESFEKAMQIFAEEMARESAGGGDPNRSRMIELELVHKDGNAVPVEGNFCFLRDSTGKPFGILSIVRDITERKRTEEEKVKLEAKLVHALKMEAIGTLAGGIAHDFNNILSAIIGNISLALLDQDEGFSRERLTEAERACLRAQMLARQLLTFAKGGAPIKKLLSVEKLVTESVSFASSGSNVRCKFSFQDNLWAVEADPGQIGQVAQNLVINAIQAMPAGGTIEVRGENLVVEVHSNLPLDAGKYVKITMQDQGIGIPEEYLSKIFDPYFTTKQTGSGLGLATAYAIVKNHRGHIGVESRLGGGTIFQIYLPAAEQGIVESLKDDRKVIKGQGKILVMDDDAGVRDMLVIMLQNLGYEAHCTEDGEEAIKLYKEALDVHQPFAVVILDLTVPGGTGGKEAIKALLKIDPQVKAIVSSGYSEDPIMAEFSAYGFSGVITKPYGVSELSKLLNTLIGKGP